MRIFAALLFASVFPAAAQSPQVPHKMEFAGITLTIRDDARREIQKDVDALTQSPRHYNIKAERAKTYFPIIEKIFREEQVPDDFKYLSLQESALIADAVSSSNAVGFWQFKDFTAIEMGLRVDRTIDERMNIVSASRAAARYIKKNNTFFDNWVYALQAYQMGAGGVMKAVNDTQSGASRMEINSRTYWYVKKFLAHKIAYEEGVKGKAATQVLTFENNNGRSLADLANEVSVDETALRNYNKWTKSGSVPADRTYVVLVPLEGNKSELPAIATGNNKTVAPAASPVASASNTAISAVKKKVNGLQAIQALNGESSSALAARAGVELAKFLKWNDIEPGGPLHAGQYYFLAKKRVRAIENFHKVNPGENLWAISQRYGVQIKKLRKYNRLRASEQVSAGTMLWLASTRPKSDVVRPVDNAIAVSQGESFNWSSSSTDASVSSGNKDTLVVPAVSVISEAQPEIKPEPVSEALPLAEKEEIEAVASNDSIATTPPDIVAAPDTVKIVAVPAVSKRTAHTVQAGETLYSIARMYQVGVMDLVNWNDLDLQQGIRPGQNLRLVEAQPVKKDPTPSKTSREVVHEVKSSDTLYSIARQYGVTIKELMDWNKKKDFSLAVGEKLRIH